MLRRNLSLAFSHADGQQIEEMRKRIACCRARLRKGRAERRIARRASAHRGLRATGEAKVLSLPAQMTQGEETEREP